MWTRKHGLTGNNLRVLESLAKFCLQFYFKIYFDVKVRHLIVDAPYHVLTGLRILRTQPKKVRDAITFYVRTGAWYSHPECLILSLLASPIISERKFAIGQVIKLRGGSEFGDNSLRPRITPKLNLSATSLLTLISWAPGKVQEPSFTCSLSTSEILGFEKIPYIPPKFTCHAQSTERFNSFHSFIRFNLFPQSSEACDRVSGSCVRPGGKRWLHPSQDTSSGRDAAIQDKSTHHGHILR